MLRWKGGAITTKIQRRKCEASLIGQLAECIYRLDKQILTSVRVRYGLDQTEWDHSCCLVPDVTKLVIKIDCRF